MVFDSLHISPGRAWSFALCLLFMPVLSFSPLAAAAEKAPMLEGNEVFSGQAVRLTDYRGMVVLVDFWASWCPPCLESLPAWERLRRELHLAGFEVIAVNVDENTSDGLEFLRERPVSYPVLADPEGRIGIPWGIRTLPRYFLVDTQGNIVSDHRRFRSGDVERLRSEILELLHSKNH